MSVVSEAEWKSIMEWGIATTVIRSDAPNVDKINILLLRESIVFFQNCSGATMRETSAMTSAAGTQRLEDHNRHRK
jgi:hypothetical protein